jgi:hypothetical protein
MGGEEGKDLTQRTPRAQRALRRGTQEHRPFGFAQGKQECLCNRRVAFLWRLGVR